MENFGYAMGSIERLHRLPRVLDLVTKVIDLPCTFLIDLALLVDIVSCWFSTNNGTIVLYET